MQDADRNSPVGRELGSFLAKKALFEVQVRASFQDSLQATESSQHMRGVV